jgi:transposase
MTASVTIVLCAERDMQPTALDRKNCPFMGAKNCDKLTDITYTLMNGGDPQTWLASILRRIPEHRINRTGGHRPWSEPWRGNTA